MIRIRDDDHLATLEARKLYRALPDADAPPGYLRGVDESGEGYVYPAALFLPVDLLPPAIAALGPGG